MSNGLAVAAATATLRQLLDRGLNLAPPPPPPPPVTVTARSPDKAREDVDGDQVNLFLYHTQLDCAFRNADGPPARPGESGHPPLPLMLFYLLTAYSDDKDDVKGHKLLGRAMSVLHDHPLLGAAEIEAATQSNVEGSDLHEQIERVRITFEPVALHDLADLWTAFQTNYRSSAAYQVSVVLIDSTRRARTPLPVLTRGRDDSGIVAQPDVTPRFPTLTGLTLPAGQASARLGDEVTLSGHHLDAGAPQVRVSNPRLDAPGPVTLVSATGTEIRFRLDDDPTRWVAGLSSVAVVTGSGGGVRSTNELPLGIAPRITTGLPLTVRRRPDESAVIVLRFRPQFRPGQRAALLVGDREVPAAPLPSPPTPTDTLRFVMPQAPLGTHVLRLRIDGADSLLIQHPPGRPPVFDPTQRVTIR